MHVLIAHQERNGCAEPAVLCVYEGRSPDRTTEVSGLLQNHVLGMAERHNARRSLELFRWL